MQIGQTYKIKIKQFNGDSNVPECVYKNAKLIFKGKYFYTFEYESKMGDLLRVTKYKRENNSIGEVI